MPVDKSWPVLLPEKLSIQGKEMIIINSSISGDTTGNALTRLPTLLSLHQPDYVLIELGANDGLRGFATNIINDNLTMIILTISASGASPLLMQIQLPPNYGQRYSQSFSDIYLNLAEQHNISLLPFFLEHVIEQPHWLMEDGLHPNIEAQPWIAEFMASEISKVI